MTETHESIMVSIPIEEIEEYLKEKGVNDGKVAYYQDVIISDVSFNNDYRYINFTFHMKGQFN